MIPGTYRSLLRVPGAPRLVVAALVGRIPIGILALAIVLFVRHQTGSFATAGIVDAGFALCSGITAPLQGRLVDRVGQGAVLAVSATINAAALAALIVVGLAGAGTIALVGLAGLAGAAIPPLSACMRSLWSTMLAGDEDATNAAYSLESVLVEVFFIAGPVLTAVLVSLASPAAAIAVGAAMMLAGTLVFASAPRSRMWRGLTSVDRTRAGALAAPGMRTLVASIVPVGMAFGSLEIAIPAFARGHGNPAAAGYLLAAMALGSLAGGLWYGARRWLGPVAGRYLLLAGLFAVGLAPLSLAGSIPLMAVLMVIAGLALAPVTACAYVLVDRVAPAGTTTEAYTWMITANVMGAAAGSALSGVLVQQSGVRIALLVACAAAGVGALVALSRRTTLFEAPASSLSTA